MLKVISLLSLLSVFALTATAQNSIDSIPAEPDNSVTNSVNQTSEKVFSDIYLLRKDFPAAQILLKSAVQRISSNEKVFPAAENFQISTKTNSANFRVRLSVFEDSADSDTISGNLPPDFKIPTVRLSKENPQIAEASTEDAKTSDSFEKPLVSETIQLREFSENLRARPENISPAGEKFESAENLLDDQSVGSNKFHWKNALIQSGIFLAIQHSFRMTEDKTRRNLDGKFFSDWKDSVKNIRGWDDGGKFFTNYIAHPLQGSVTGRIFVNNSDRAKAQEFGASKDYWQSRLKAMLWSAAWSTQFEIGPLSEASLGNVGQFNKTGRSALSWGDMIVTPTLGTGFLIGEDIIDKYILEKFVNRKVNKYLANFIRTFMTPTMSFANLLRGKPFWYRDKKPLKTDID